LNFEACNILGIDEENENVVFDDTNVVDNTMKREDVDKKTLLLSENVRNEISPDMRFSNVNNSANKFKEISPLYDTSNVSQYIKQNNELGPEEYNVSDTYNVHQNLRLNNN